MSFNPGDVEIREALVSGYMGSVDIARRIHKLSVFESVLKPYTTLTMEIVDNADVLNWNVSLDGKNEISLAFGQPGQESYSGKWSLMAVEKSRALKNQRTVTYSVTGYSRHMTRFPKVQRAFKNQTATSVVQNLVSSYLYPDKPLLIRAPSRGMLGNETMPYNVNGIQIHKAIRSTLLRAASSVDPSSAYVMFENKNNLVVDTLENMLNTGLGSPVATFFQRPMGKDFLVDVAMQPFVILSMREDSRASRPSSIQDEAQAVNTNDFFDNKFTKGKTTGAASYLNIPYNSLRPPTFMSQFLEKRKKMAGEFDGQAVTVQVSLNTDVTVGSGFAVETLIPAGDTDQPVQDRVSGPLVATEVRHLVVLDKQRMQGTSIVRGTRGPEF